MIEAHDRRLLEPNTAEDVAPGRGAELAWGAHALDAEALSCGVL
jgi:hypothetical protein